MNELEESFNKLLSYIEKENYTGHDPYDALKSPIFRLPVLRSNKFLRFAFQQVIKRSPLNLRPLFFIPKGYNPVTVGLCIQAYARLCKVYPENKSEYIKKIDFLIDELEKLIPKGFSGACWGYDFDWAARYSNIPAYQPTVVATGIITNALFIAHQTSKNPKALNLCISAADFVLKDLNRTFDSDKDYCFSYSPFDKQTVYNASMKGVRLLAQVYSITQNEQLKKEAEKAASYIVKKQSNDGSWIYSGSRTGGWIDNYHTGYVLDCLADYILYTQDKKFEPNLKKGYEFYVQHFFDDMKIPKFYHNKTFPVDCTAASQALLTLSRFKNTALATDVALWMHRNMQHPQGYFYFRKFRYYTVKTSFMRWSNAWMFAGLAELLYESMQPEIAKK
ncbi:MAG: delta-aminolevulinic acid dehydratase [Bacteroidia bacterium]